jgi:hypothetical protein
VLIALLLEQVFVVDNKCKFALIRIPAYKSYRKFLFRVHDWLKVHMHWKRRDQKKQLTQLLVASYLE